MRREDRGIYELMSDRGERTRRDHSERARELKFSESSPKQVLTAPTRGGLVYVRGSRCDVVGYWWSCGMRCSAVELSKEGTKRSETCAWTSLDELTDTRPLSAFS